MELFLMHKIETLRNQMFKKQWMKASLQMKKWLLLVNI
jgi:hypothetical protein